MIASLELAGVLSRCKLFVAGGNNASDASGYM